jgi:hypothetical protein
VVKSRHGLQERGERVAVAAIEQAGQGVEGIGRDSLQGVGGHGVLL